MPALVVVLQLLRPLAARIGPVLGYSAATGALLLIAAAAATRQPRRRSAATRHAFWTAAVLAHLLLPVLVTWVPARGAALPDAVSGWGAARSARLVLTRIPGGVEGAVTRTTANDMARPARSIVRSAAWDAGGDGAGVRGARVRAEPPLGGAWWLAPVVAALWLASALAVLLRPAVGGWQVRRIARAGARLDDGPWRALADEVAAGLGITRAVVLWRAAGPVVPMTWGVVRPTILLPSDADGWPEPRRRAVLAHEMAHVRRGDAATQGLARLVLAGFWFDPLVWLAVRRMRVERERACDDLALLGGMRPSTYAGELLACARAIPPVGWWPATGGTLAFARRAVGRHTEFEGRLRAVLDPRQARARWTRRDVGALACGAALACVALASARPAAARPAVGRRPAPGGVAARHAAAVGALGPVPARTIAGLRRRTVAAGVPAVGAPPAADPLGWPDPLRESARACDDVADTTRPATVWIYADVPGGGRRTEYRRTAPGRCAQVAVVGSVHLDARDADVVAFAPGTAVLIRERRAGADGLVADRAVRVTTGEDGRPAHAYTVDGRPATFDAAARDWLARVTPALVREAGLDAPARVARWRLAGGVPGVLRGISGLESDVARRTHYLALLDGRNGGALEPGEVTAVARQARHDLEHSPDDLRDVLARLAPP